MSTPLKAVAVSLTAVFATAGLMAPADAAPSCIAQSVQVEHEAYGPAWGADVIAYLATHPEVLEEFGFQSFGGLASYGARQDHASCPADL